MNYILYKPTTGEITRSINCPENLIQIQLGIDEDFIEGSADDSMQYVENNSVVDMPQKLNKYCIFDYDIKQWVDPRTPETQWPIIRVERNQRLQSTDWTQLADIPAATKTLWEPYRQALRDVTNQPDPFNIVWPTPPTA